MQVNEKEVFENSVYYEARERPQAVQPETVPEGARQPAQERVPDSVYEYAEEVPEGALEFAKECPGVEPEDGCPDIYVVRPGDTFYGIAEMLGISTYALALLNSRVDPDTLRPGDRLCIPLAENEACATEVGEPAAEAAQVTAPPIVAPTPPIAAPPADPIRPIVTSAPPIAILPSSQCPADHVRITVPNGWDFGNILIRYGVSYDALQNANPSVSIDSLRAGQVLCVPPSGSRGLCTNDQGFTYIVERSDTLDSIARRYRTTTSRLLRANPNLAPQDFITGRVVCIPG